MGRQRLHLRMKTGRKEDGREKKSCPELQSLSLYCHSFETRHSITVIALMGPGVQVNEGRYSCFHTSLTKSVAQAGWKAL